MTQPHKLPQNLLSVALLMLLAACSANVPEPILAKSDWLDYSDQRAGYAIKYPAKYRLVPGGNGEVAFRGQDKMIAYRISIATFEEAKKRGLWVVTEPIGTTYVSGGFTSHRYVYKHGGFLKKESRVAFVLEREGGKMLALEFAIGAGNTEGTLDEGQEAVLKSWTIL